MTMNTHIQRTLAAFAVVGTFGFAAWAGSAIASADQGMINEDEPGWSCVDDGNKICGPGNEQGAPAGRYDVGGVLVDPWPVGVGPIADMFDDIGYDAGYEN